MQEDVTLPAQAVQEPATSGQAPQNCNGNSKVSVAPASTKDMCQKPPFLHTECRSFNSVEQLLQSTAPSSQPPRTTHWCTPSAQPQHCMKIRLPTKHELFSGHHRAEHWRPYVHQASKQAYEPLQCTFISSSGHQMNGARHRHLKDACN